MFSVPAVFFLPALVFSVPAVFLVPKWVFGSRAAVFSVPGSVFSVPAGVFSSCDRCFRFPPCVEEGKIARVFSVPASGVFGSRVRCV